MKKLLVDANFQNNTFLEQMQSALFKACAKVDNDYEFYGFHNQKLNEEFSTNFKSYQIYFGNFNGLWQSIIPPAVALFQKNIPFYFPCGNIPDFLPAETPVISFVNDLLPIECSGYFKGEEAEKIYRRKLQTDINRSDLIFVPSNHTKKILEQEFLVTEEPVVLNYASLIPDEYMELPLSRNKEEYFFVDINNISHTGLNELLKDFIYLHTTAKNGRRLYLNGILRSTNQELLINLEVARKVGAIREYQNLTSGQRASLLKGAIAALLPSNIDILPILHLDAMKCSCPVVTDATPEVKEVCSDAVIYADIRETSIYNNVLQLLSKDENTRNEYIKKGQERQKMFYWNNSAQTFLQHVEILANE